MEQNTEVLDATMQEGTEDTSGTEVGSVTAPGTQNTEGNEQVKPFVVRYKHKNMELTPEEAKNYAQKGMKYDDISGMLDDLSYLATIKDKKPHELLKEIIANEESTYRESLIDRIGDDEEAVEALMEKYRIGNKSKFEKAQTEKKKAEEDAELREVEALETRVANEFGEVAEAFPEVKSIDDIPKSVLEEARKGRNLFDAYLRYRHAEFKKIDSAKQTAESNAKSTAGSMSGTNDEDSTLNAFLKGLRS